MKKVILYVLIIVSVVLIGLLANHNFLLPDDSYEFLLLSSGKLGNEQMGQNTSGSYTLGQYGDLYTVNSINRIGYGSLIGMTSNIFFQNNSILAAKIVNLISVAVIGILVFEILKNFKLSNLKSFLGALSVITFSTIIWLSNGVFNDITGIAFLLCSFYLALKYLQNKRSVLVVLSLSALLVASLMRLEYFLGIIPLVGLFRFNWKKTFLIIALLLLSILLLAIPLFSTSWISNQLSVFKDANYVQIISLVLAGLMIILNLRFKQKIIKPLTVIVFVIYILLPTVSKELFFFDFTAIQFLPMLILLALFAIFKLGQLKNTNHSHKNIEIFSLMTLLFAAFYHTYHFHHLVVIFPFAMIYLIIRLDEYRFSDLLKISVLVFFIIINIGVFNSLFLPYKIDVPQQISSEVNKLLNNQVGSSEDNPKPQNSVIISDFPLETYYWTNTSSRSIRSSLENTLRSKYLITVNPTNRAENIDTRGYVLIDKQTKTLEIPYQMYFQNKPITDFRKYEISIYKII